jgi:hypothetical protein
MLHNHNLQSLSIDSTSIPLWPVKSTTTGPQRSPFPPVSIGPDPEVAWAMQWPDDVEKHISDYQTSKIMRWSMDLYL